MSAAERLYTPELLALTVKLANWPLAGDWPLEGAARSPTCGSTIALGLALGEGGRIDRFGMRVSACAVGQASAAIFAEGAEGRSADEVTQALGAMEGWLAGEGDRPDWPGIDAIAAARVYPARHGAMLLPWKAAADALSKHGSGG